MKKQFQIWVALFLFPALAFATGISKPVLVGPKAIGMGGAFVGIADDPTAIFHNPAGITQLKGHQIEVGADSLISDEEYTFPAAATEKAKHQLIPVPQFSYVDDHFRPISLGLGVFFPHGNGGKFESASANPLNPNEGRIYSMEISPTMAWEIFDGFSVGGSLRFIRVSSNLQGQLFVIPAGSTTITDTLNDLSVKGWDVGMSAGVFYRPCSYFAWGANYRSSVDVKLSGTAQFATLGNFPTNFVQTLPTLFTTGFSLIPIEKLTVALSYDFERNSEVKALNVNLGNIPVTLPENWSDSHTLHLGGEYWLNGAWAVRAGYAKDLNDSIPDEVMNRIIGDIAAHETSLGVAYKWNRYQFEGTWNGRFGKRGIPVTATNVSPGSYKAFVNSLSIAVSAAL